MRDMYLAGVDLYTRSAMETFGFDEHYCVDGAYDPTGTYQPRKLLKEGVLAYLYGQSAKSFARRMKVTDEVAQQFFTNMITRFPSIKQFREDTLAALLTNGPMAHVETLFGRKRRFPDYRKDYAELQRLNKIPRFKMSPEQQQRRNELWGKCAYVERAAINTIVQGTAADVIKQIMIRMHAFCRERGYTMPASIHDEVMTCIPKINVTRETIQSIEDIMTNTVTFSVPIKCDTVIQPRWMEEYKKHQWDFENNKPLEAA